MAPVHATRWGSGDAAVLVHGSFGWGEDTWKEQRPLVDDYALILVDRRGFGRSPADGRVDFERDAADVASLLERPAHLVGHSYGGVASLLAAARRPEAVRSLTVIEPPALALVRGMPVVESFIAELDELARTTDDPSVYRTGFLQAFGFPARHEELHGMELEAARSSMTERPPYEAVIPLDELARAPFPKLVIRGDWRTTQQTAQERGARIFHAICDVLEERLGARGATLAGAHSPQVKGARFNDCLRSFWHGAEAYGRTSR